MMMFTSDIFFDLICSHKFLSTNDTKERNCVLVSMKEFVASDSFSLSDLCVSNIFSVKTNKQHISLLDLLAMDGLAGPVG